ncbi:MAG: protein O-mannosyl-transferase family, partial [Planctomycetota bacterium]
MAAEPTETAGEAEASPAPVNAGGWTVPLLAALAAAWWWGRRAAPGVTFEDSGELVGAALEFGVPHPPGYPLWTWIAGGTWRMADLFGGVSVARWAALVSVFFGALTVLFLVRLARASGAGRLTALVVGYALVASSAFSSQAVVP